VEVRQCEDGYAYHLGERFIGIQGSVITNTTIDSLTAKTNKTWFLSARYPIALQSRAMVLLL